MSLWPWLWGACHYDLDLWPFDAKIYRCLPFFILHLCMKNEVCRSNTVRVIALQRSVDRRTDGQTDRRTDRRTDKVITIGLPHLRWRGPNYFVMPSAAVLYSLYFAVTHPPYFFITKVKSGQVPVQMPFFSTLSHIFILSRLFYVYNKNNLSIRKFSNCFVLFINYCLMFYITSQKREFFALQSKCLLVATSSSCPLMKRKRPQERLTLSSLRHSIWVLTCALYEVF